MKINLNKPNENRITQILKNDKKKFFTKNFLPFLMNFDNEDYETVYFHKYNFLILEILLALNAYLLDLYIEWNESNAVDDNWKTIYNKKNQENKITFLLYFLLSKHTDMKSEQIEVLYKIYVYEMIYRHQISHGWINSLSNFNELYKKPIKLKTSDDLTLFLSLGSRGDSNKLNESLNSNKRSDLDDLRERLKKHKYNTKILEKNRKKIFQAQSPLLGKTIVYEPTIIIKINNENLIQMKKNEWNEYKKTLSKEQSEKSKSFKKFMIGRKYVEWEFSLNCLIREITTIVKELDIEYKEDIKSIWD